MRLLLTSLYICRFRIEDGYNVTAINQYVEWITIEAFDLRAERESCAIADHHAPLWPRPRDGSGTDNFYNVVSFSH